MEVMISWLAPFYIEISLVEDHLNFKEFSIGNIISFPG